MIILIKKIYARISKLYKVDKYTDSRNYEIYTVGEFTGYPEVTRMKNEMIQQGIKDAFIAAFHNDVGSCKDRIASLHQLFQYGFRVAAFKQGPVGSFWTPGARAPVNQP